VKAADILAAAERLPLCDLADLQGRGLVVIAPHPDDESLGCGGLIAGWRARGNDARVVVLSDGTGSHPNSRAYPPERLRLLREHETLAACHVLGLSPRHVTFMRLPDRFLPSEGPTARETAARIAMVARECGAGAIICTWRHDPHCDHQAAFAMARLARRDLPDVRLLAYSIWGWSLPGDMDIADDVVGGFRVDISHHLAAKQRAIQAHRSQTTDLIFDDPAGFRLDQATVKRFERPFEIFWEVAP
jgi:LmbE family N-acetylglucosaminyl deacetylase